MGVKKKRKFNLKSILIGTLRRRWLYSPMRAEALNAEKVDQTKGALTRYKCAKCKKKHAKSDVMVDHIDPVVKPEVGFPRIRYSGFTDWIDDWSLYIFRLFVSADKLQVLCKPCHDKKSKKERKRGRSNRTT